MIPCHICGKHIKIDRTASGDGDPYTSIQHFQQRGANPKEIYFHTSCFIEVAGEEYAPKQEVIYDGGSMTAEQLAQELIRESKKP